MQITIDTTTEPRASAIDAVKFLRYFFNITAAEMGDVVNETVTTLKAPPKSDATIIAEEATRHIVKKAIEKMVAGKVIEIPPVDLDPAAVFGVVAVSGDATTKDVLYHADPAAIFGANPLPNVQPAPSTAAATPLPIAPVGLQVGPVTPAVATSLPAAQPAPTVPAPINPAVPTIHASGVEIDAEGLPWDSRIHATTKNKTQKGIWKARKGLNDEGLVNRVKTELKALMAMPVAAAPAVAAMQQTVTAMETISMPPMARTDGEALAQAQATLSPMLPPVVPTGMPMPPAPAPVPTGNPTTMLELMPRVTSAVLANKLPQNALLDAVVAVGMPSIPSLQQRPDMVPEVWNRLNALYPGVLV